MLVVKPTVCNNNNVDSGVRFKPSHTIPKKVGKLNKHWFSGKLEGNLKFKEQQQQAKISLYNTLKSKHNNYSSMYYKVCTNSKYEVYMLNIVPGCLVYETIKLTPEQIDELNSKFGQNTTTSQSIIGDPGVVTTPTACVDDCNKNEPIYPSDKVNDNISLPDDLEDINDPDLDLENPLSEFIEIRGKNPEDDKISICTKVFSIVFYCNSKGKVVRQPVYFKETKYTFAEKWKTIESKFGKMAALNVISIDFSQYNISNVYQDAKLPKYISWNISEFTNPLYESDDRLFDHFFANTKSDQLVKVKIDHPIKYKQKYGDRVQIYQCGQGQSKSSYAALDVDKSHTELTKDNDVVTQLRYEDEYLKFSISPTGEVTMDVSNSNIAEFSMIGYKLAKTINNELEVIIKLGIYRNAKVATTCESNAKIRTNHCKVLQINIVNKVDDNWVYGKKIRKAKSSVFASKSNFIYTVGDDITINDFDPNLEEVCKPGIHFFSIPELALRNYSSFSAFKYLIKNAKNALCKAKTTDNVTKSSNYDNFRKEQGLNVEKECERIDSIRLGDKIDVTSDNFLDLDDRIGLRNRQTNEFRKSNQEANLVNRLNNYDGSYLLHATDNIDELDLANKTTYYKSKLDLKGKRKLD